MTFKQLYLSMGSTHTRSDAFNRSGELFFRTLLLTVAFPHMLNAYTLYTHHHHIQYNHHTHAYMHIDRTSHKSQHKRHVSHQPTRHTIHTSQQTYTHQIIPFIISSYEYHPAHHTPHTTYTARTYNNDTSES